MAKITITLTDVPDGEGRPVAVEMVGSPWFNPIDPACAESLTQAQRIAVVLLGTIANTGALFGSAVERTSKPEAPGTVH